MDDSEQIKMFVIMLCNFTALVIMYFITCYSKDGRDYRDGLKELKNIEKGEGLCQKSQ